MKEKLKYNFNQVYLIIAIVLFQTSNLFAQESNCFNTGSDLTVTGVQTIIVNTYHPGTASAVAGSNSITLGTRRTTTGATDIASGDLLLIIQMQGTEIDATIADLNNNGTDDFTTTDYGDGAGGLDNQGFLDNGNFIAGQYEYVIASNAITAAGGDLTIEGSLFNKYLANTTPTATIGRRTYQVIKVGNYNDLTIQAGGEITTVPWNGSTGGIIAIDVLGTLDLQGTIDADFAGFRGGYLNPNVDNGGGTPTFNSDPGFRGEGIVGTPTQVYAYLDDFSDLSETIGITQGYPGGTATETLTISFGGGTDRTFTFEADRGIGGAGNAGGAGLLNGGGAGGGNGASGGSGANTFFLPSSGGIDMNLDQGNRLFLGGGGGSGGQSDGANTGFSDDVASGKPGGGAVLIRAETISSTTGIINLNGDDGGTNVDDVDGGGGGGGAGGTLVLITSTEDISGLTINATGGDGANLTGAVQGAADGGGAGGGGGNVLLIKRGDTFSAIPTVNSNGGALGTTQGTPDDESVGGDASVSIANLPPSPVLDCPLVSLPTPTPGGVGNSILWMRADANAVYNGSNEITEWGDFSTSGFNLTNTGVTGLTGTTPDFIDGSFTDTEASSNPEFNFNPSVSFSGADDYLGFENFTSIGTADVTLFVVANLPTASNADQTLTSYLPSDSQDDGVDLGTTGTNVRTSIIDNNVDIALDIKDDITRIIATDYDNTDVNLWVNNGTATNSALTAGTIDTDGIFVIGQDIDDFGTPAFDGTRELEGQIGDILVFDGILTDTERQQVSSYLAIKYGITLDQTVAQDYLNSIGESIFPASTDAANYGAYDNDIAGIGSDDGSRLSQLRSKSINASTMLTASATSFIDRQFVIWGNNAAGVAFNTTEISAGITERIQREWRVAVSNTSDPIDLTFDLSGTTNTPIVTDQVALIIDDNGDFSDGFLRTQPASSWDGTTATFLNVTLNDDEVITIGEVPSAPGGVLAGLSLWLRSDSGVTSGGDGTEITQWDDQSSNGSSFTSSTYTVPTETGPLFEDSDVNFNGNPSFAFNDNYLAVDNYNQFPASSDFTFFSVQRPDAAATEITGSLVCYGADKWKIRSMSGVAAEADNENLTFGVDIRSLTTILRYEWIETGIISAGDDFGSLFINSIEAPVSPITVSPGLDILPNGQDFNIGIDSDNVDATFGATTHYIGDLGEMIIYDAILVGTDLRKIESYLAIKYGITLPFSDGNYIASDGSLIYEEVIVPAEYNNDIAGIGRDDISTLDQRKSLSRNTDAIVTIALTDNGGTFASPNAFAADLSFMAWGNDNDDDGTIEEISTEIPSNIATRLDREWRVQERGSIGNVSLSIDISAVAGVTGTVIDDFLLLVDPGGDFSSGLSNSFAPTSFAANVLTFDNIDFSNGDVFTVATSKVASTPGGVSSNLAVWLRADREVFSDDGGTTASLDTDGVQVWNDQAQGTSFVEDLYSAGTTPEFISSEPSLNGQPALDFNNGGSGDYLAATIVAGGAQTGASLLSVFRTTDTQSSMLSYQDGAGNDIQLEDPEAFLGTVGSTNTGASFTDVVANDGVGHLASFDWLNTNNNFNFFLDGTADASNGDLSGTDSYDLGGDLTLGQTLNDPLSGGGTGGFTGGEEFNGLISEAIIYNQQLVTTDRDRVQSYLALKHGLTLNSGDFDYTSPNGSIFFPGNSDANYASFRTDVAGIGRDDLSDFEILTSGSINTTAILSINKDASFDADDQYFTWAHNGLAAADGNSSDIPSGIEGRLGRVWKIKMTNSPSGSVDLTFDLSSQGVTVASDLRLLVDEDGTFANATVLSPSITQSVDDFTFNNVALSSLSDEFFFTVATRDQAASPLPLDFLSFTGLTTSGLVTLNWETTNEIDVSYFEVERSEDGQHFSYVGNVKALNISDAINQYSFRDDRPLSGFAYYRLKEVDFDGASEYSNVITVANEADRPKILAYPNPTQEFLNIESANVLTGSKYTLVDIMGSVILKGTWGNESGRTQKLNMRHLPVGVYQLTIQTPIGTERIKVMKK